MGCWRRSTRISRCPHATADRQLGPVGRLGAGGPHPRHGRGWTCRNAPPGPYETRGEPVAWPAGKGSGRPRKRISGSPAGLLNPSAPPASTAPWRERSGPMFVERRLANGSLCWPRTPPGSSRTNFKKRGKGPKCRPRISSSVARTSSFSSSLRLLSKISQPHTDPWPARLLLRLWVWKDEKRKLGTWKLRLPATQIRKITPHELVG